MPTQHIVLTSAEVSIDQRRVWSIIWTWSRSLRPTANGSVRAARRAPRSASSTSGEPAGM